MDFLQIVMTPFSWIMKSLYFLLFENYGLALFAFALIVKVILFPFSLKGKKSMIQMNMLSGKMQQIQKKYANDKNRQNLEIQKLYEKENVNPMGGCLWSMLPIAILLPLYAVVRRPLRYLMGLNDTVIAAVTAAVTGAGVTLNQTYPEISIVSAFHSNPAILEAGKAAAGGADLFGMNFNFLGIDLAAQPQLKFWVDGLSWPAIGLFLIPVISAIFAFVSSRIMMKTNSVNQQQPQEGAAASTNKMMMWMTPLMSLYIGFIMPASMSIYWIANSIFSVAQELIAGRMLKKDYEAAAAARAEQEALEKEEEKRQRREAAERKAQAIAEGKAKKGKKGQQEKKPKDTAVISVSSVGTRAYARGRAYDPYRFSESGPTEYQDPTAPIDENAVEKALEKKAEHLEEVALEVAADDMIMDELAPKTDAPVDEAGSEPADAAVEEAAEADPWAALDQEIEQIQDAPDGEEPKE